MDTLLSRLKELRKRLYLNQVKFAARMGVRPTTWSNIEAGTNPCSDRYIKLICLTFNVQEEWLRTGHGEIFKPAPEPQPRSLTTSVFSADGKPLPPDIAELVAIYLELGRLNREAVLNFAETTLQAQRNTIKDIEATNEDDATRKESLA